MVDFTLLTFVILSIAGNYFFTRWFLRYAKVRRITDIPTERSSHFVPTPRGGGVGFVIVSLPAILLYLWFGERELSAGVLIFLFASAGVACLGWFDDRNDLSKRVRFSVQLIAAVLILWFVAPFDRIEFPLIPDLYLGLAGGIVGIIWITGATNIFNFMDGIDGIATLQAISTALGWMIFAWLWGEPVLFSVNILMISVLVAFLAFNWAPAKLFMGDVGSVYLGFVFAGMPFLAASLTEGVGIGQTIWTGGLLLWPFLFDGSYTILRRLRNGENIFEAHRSHLYQRLNIIGWGHAKITILYFCFSLVGLSAALGFAFGKETVSILIFLMLLIFSLLFARFVHRLETLFYQKKE